MTSRPPLLSLRPYHLARFGLALAVVLLLVDPNFGWLIVAGTCAGLELQTRTKRVKWTPGVQSFLIRHRLAPDPQMALVTVAVSPAQPSGDRGGATGPVIPFAPLSFGDILTGAFRAIRRYWPALIGFTLTLMVAALVAFSVLARVVFTVALDTGADSSISGFLAHLMLGLIFLVVVLCAIGIPVDAMVNAVCVITADRAVRGERAPLSEVVGAARRRFWPLCRLMVVFYTVFVAGPWLVEIAAFLVAGFGTGVAALPFVFIAIYVLGIVFSLAPVVMTLEGTGVVESLSRSAALVKPAFLRVVGLQLLWSVLVVGALMLSGLPFGLISLLVPSDAVVTVFVPLYLVIAVVVAFPLFRAVQTLIYTDLRLRSGTYGAETDWRSGKDGVDEHPVAGDGGISTPNAIVTLRPYHVCRIVAAFALFQFIFDLPGIPWLIIVTGCAAGEWFIRSRGISWGPEIGATLAALRLYPSGTAQPDQAPHDEPPQPHRNPANDPTPPAGEAADPAGAPEPEGANTVRLGDNPLSAPPAADEPERGAVLPPMAAEPQYGLPLPPRPAPPRHGAVVPTPSTQSGSGPAALTPSAQSGDAAVAPAPSAEPEYEIPPSAATEANPENAAPPRPTDPEHRLSVATSFTPQLPPLLEPAASPSDQLSLPQETIGRSDRGRLPGAGLTALILAILLVVGGAAIWWATRDDTAVAMPPSNGQLRSTFPEKPSPTWTVHASDVFGQARFAAPVPSVSNAPGFIDLGDILITTAYKRRTDGGADLVAVDSASGVIKWTTHAGFGVSCAAQTLGGLLPCAVTHGMGPDHVDEVIFVKISNGTIDHRLPANDVQRIAVVGNDIVTAGHHGISRGTATDLTRRWTTAWVPQGSCPGSGDIEYFGATDEFAYYGDDTGALVVRSSDGRRVIDSEALQPVVYPGHGLVAQTCAAGDTASRQTVVLDDTGGLLRTHPGGGRYASPLVLADQPDRYIVDGAAYNFRDGVQAWSHGSGVADIIDDTVLMVLSDRMSAINFTSGNPRWTTEFEPVHSYTAPFRWITDRQRVLFTIDDTVRAVNLHTGVTDWTLPVGDGNPVAAGTGFAVASADAITFYGPTGGAAGETANGKDASNSGISGTRLVTKCGNPPEMTPVNYRTDAGGLVVRMELRAKCPGGDILSTDGLRITVSERGRAVAGGVFDFSGSPLYLPAPDGGGARSGLVEHEFRFPVGTFWRLPNSIGGQSDPSAQSAGGDKTQLVDCVDTGTSRGPSQGEYRDTAGSGAPSAATQPATPASLDPEIAALDALRAQADADRPSVQKALADRWVPQLSSKREGLVAPDVDGHLVTWSATEILQQHLRLRLQYPEVRLVWSDEWRTYDQPGWWVTIAGVTFADPDGANGWCDGHSIAVNECFAKLVSNTRDSAGTTKYRK
ncbi:PQQ-binding-like beta-propeller repeat protein [Nocardia nova]|uniref:PQQ-binding-like beta-propeller repeat protein n=1 Tax=Nocardia nova TaxID=37330 RepID=UPI001C457073|nr:PQQ-binding-like beta-propeller repeat protein [Nocardia nova]MBV7703958.1 PQQ-binding-like beta-propeller repeat protein [Nocardia nova]